MAINSKWTQKVFVAAHNLIEEVAVEVLAVTSLARAARPDTGRIAAHAHSHFKGELRRNRQPSDFADQRRSGGRLQLMVAREGARATLIAALAKDASDANYAPLKKAMVGLGLGC